MGEPGVTIHYNKNLLTLKDRIMYRISFISLTAIAITVTATSHVNAQKASPKTFSIGPAIEINSQGASLGIQGKIRVTRRFEVRPIVLFGYEPNVEGTATVEGQQTSAGLSQDQIALYQLGQCAAPTGFCSAPGSITSPSTQTSSSRTVKIPAASGTAYGVALTYDLTSPRSRLQAYVGPRILFASTSGNQDGYSIKAHETNIGLIVGGDYAISPSLTAGLNATYNFSRSGSYTLTNTQNNSSKISISGGDLRVGINFGYAF